MQFANLYNVWLKNNYGCKVMSVFIASNLDVVKQFVKIEFIRPEAREYVKEVDMGLILDKCYGCEKKSEDNCLRCDQKSAYIEIEELTEFSNHDLAIMSTDGRTLLYMETEYGIVKFTDIINTTENKITIGELIKQNKANSIN